jgi:hypothetical protein
MRSLHCPPETEFPRWYETECSRAPSAPRGGIGQFADTVEERLYWAAMGAESQVVQCVRQLECQLLGDRRSVHRVDCRKVRPGGSGAGCDNVRRIDRDPACASMDELLRSTARRQARRKRRKWTRSEVQRKRAATDGERWSFNAT